MDQDTLNVEWVSVEKLFCSPANPRHNDDAVPHVAASIQRFGWRQPIVAKPTGEVIAGNTRLKAAQSLELPQVPVVWFRDSDLDATAYAIADNRSHEFAAWSEPDLARLLKELQAEDALDGVGYDRDDIDALLAELEEDVEVEDIDDPGPGEPPTDPVTRPDDLWILGEHRLLCGDSTNRDHVLRLVDGASIDLVLTDPPFGVSYVGKTRDALRIENDEEGQLRNLLDASFRNALEVCRDGAVWYVASPAGPQLYEFATVLLHNGVWRQTIVWVKNTMVLGHSDFNYRHEFLLYGWKPGASHRPPPNRRQTTVWEFDRPTASREHPTMKPVALFAHALQNSSARGDTILDPFVGAGTTVIAAEQLGRKAFALDIDPRYCDVTVRRWQEATGKQAILDGTESTFASVAAERADAACEVE